MANAIGLKSIYHTQKDRLLKLRGFTLLNLQQTVSFMSQYKIKSIPGEITVLPKITNIADNEVSGAPNQRWNSFTSYPFSSFS